MKNLSYGSNGEEVVLLQRALNELLNKNNKPDGGFGKITEECLRLFQTKNRLPVNGVYGVSEQAIIEPFIKKKYIRLGDIDAIATKARLPVSIIKAIRIVEAKSAGFLNDGRPIILFERHKFYQELLTKYGKATADKNFKSFPSICNPERGGYRGNELEYERIAKAIAVSREAALLSASYGLFQIMGFNYKAAGYISVENFVTAMKESETNHLLAVLSFIKSSSKLKAAVENKDYQLIAKYYNGPNYAENNYDTKLRDAALKFI